MGDRIKIILTLLLIPNICLAASIGTVSNYTVQETFVVASGTALARGDIVTGGTSGATGIMVTPLKCVRINGTDFTDGGETVTNQEADTTVLTSALGADAVDIIVYTGIEAPDSTADTGEAIDISETDWITSDSSVFEPGDYIMVDGDAEICRVYLIFNATRIQVDRAQLGTAAETHATTTNINTISDKLFRDIRDASNAGTWGIHTDPSATDHFLLLDADIYIGSQDGTQNTVAISKQEMVDITATATNAVHSLGDSNFDTYLQLGDAKYGDGLESSFPPAFTLDGSTLNTYLISNLDSYGKIRLYASHIKGGDNYNTIEYYGDSIVSGGDMQRFYLAQFGSSDIKVHNYAIQNAPSGGSVPGAGGMTWLDVTVVDCYYTLFGGGHFAGEISNSELLFRTGSPYGTLFGGFFGFYHMEVKNSSADFATMAPFLSSTEYLVKKSFDLNVIDYKYNPIENVNIKVVDKSGNSAIFVDSGETVTEILDDTDTTSNISADLNDSQTTIGVSAGHNLDDDDYIRFDSLSLALYNNYEFVKVGTAGATSLTGCTRGAWNTQPTTVESAGGGGNVYKADQLLYVSDYTEFDAGDVLLVNGEKMLVTYDTANPLSVERGYLGSHASIHEIGSKVYDVEDTIQTDSDGDTETIYLLRQIAHGSPAKNFLSSVAFHEIYNDFELTVYKDGYETYKQIFRLGGETSKSSLKTDVYNNQIKLRNSPTPGRDSMGINFQ